MENLEVTPTRVLVATWVNEETRTESLFEVTHNGKKMWFVQGVFAHNPNEELHLENSLARYWLHQKGVQVVDVDAARYVHMVWHGRA